MAWSFRGLAQAGDTQTTSITTSGNGSVQEGDLVVADVWSDTAADVHSATQGTGAAWTKAETAAGGGHAHSIFWKIANGTEPSTFNFTRDGSSEGYAAIVRVYNPNGDTVTVEDTSIVTDDTAGDPTTAAVVVVAGDGALLHVCFTNDSSTTINTDPSDMSPAGGDLLNQDSTPTAGSTSGASYYNLTQGAGSVTKSLDWVGSDTKISTALTAYLTAGGASPIQGITVTRYNDIV